MIETRFPTVWLIDRGNYDDGATAHMTGAVALDGSGPLQETRLASLEGGPDEPTLAVLECPSAMVVVDRKAKTITVAGHPVLVPVGRVPKPKGRTVRVAVMVGAVHSTTMERYRRTVGPQHAAA